MARHQALDTSRLIAHWKRKKTRSIGEHTKEDAADWARELVGIERVSSIFSPVAIEFLCGVMNSHELELAQAFLDQFTIIDGGNLPREDWAEARRYAQWSRGDAKPRSLGDCLIFAIAKRLNYDLITNDDDLRRRSSSPRSRGKS
jgi:predicted nucleic acid-binding protein